MTEPKQFICSFLGIPETGFAEVQINSKLMCDMLVEYHAEKHNEFISQLTSQETEDIERRGYPTLYPATNDTQTEYGNKFSQPPTDTKLPILFADTESKSIMVKKTDGSIAEIEPIDPSSETKYPNLLNATKTFDMKSVKDISAAHPNEPNISE